MSKVIPIYVVYFNTRDCPGEYSARRQVCSAPDGEPLVEVDADLCARGKTLQDVRDELQSLRMTLGLPRLHRILPMPGDDPVVVEIWL